jgi:glycosyltransferase involved in cell wall biosynthesis
MTTVLHLIPTLAGGGAERQLSLLAIEQARRGVEVHVGIRRGGAHFAALRDNGVHLHSLGDFGGFDLRLLISIQRLIRKSQPDIVQTWLLQMDIVGGLAALLTGTSWIITERTSAEQYTTVPVQGWSRLQLGRFASALVANSQTGQDYWRRSLSTRPDSFLIRNALELEKINSSNAKKLVDTPHNDKLLLVVGRFSPEKSLDVIVEAAATLPPALNTTVLMIGEGPLLDSIRKQIDRAGLSDRVLLVPYQPDWWGWLKTAKALISMSRHEGNPNVVLEAMAGACPLIVSDIPAHREILDASCASVVPPNDARVLSEAMVKLLSDPTDAREKATRALERVSNLTVEATAEAYDSVYKHILNKPKTRRRSRFKR